jgi:hypothetical protein
MKVRQILIVLLIIYLVFTSGCRQIFGDDQQPDLLIHAPVEGSQIIITSPKQGSIWNPGDTIVIKWINNSIAKIDIQLYRKSAYQFSIAENINNIQTYSWKIPDSINLSNQYLLKIMNHNNTGVYQFSGRFGIQ